MKKVFDKKYGKNVIKVEYTDEKDKELKLQQFSDFILIGEENTIEGNFLVFEDSEEEMQKLREQVIEKILEDEDITEIKKKYKELKSKLLSLESKFKEDFVNKCDKIR